MGPEQALVILFRDSNMNAVDIDESKGKKVRKLLPQPEILFGRCLCVIM